MKLAECVIAVEENNRMNKAEWRDWQSAHDIFIIYEISADGDYHLDIQLLKMIIETNGVFLDGLIELVDNIKRRFGDSTTLGR